MWLKDKYNLGVLLIIFLTGIVYRNSFISPFFQDDKILLNLSFLPLANFPYRPISQQLFYFLSHRLFGMNVLGFHLVLFLAFSLTMYVLFHLATILLKDKTKALAAVFFYALNISLFANFYWVATSYFSIGALFFFLTLYFYVKKRTWLTFFSWILALGSNEIAFVLPIIFLTINWLEYSWPKCSWIFLVSLPIFLWFRILIGFPKAADYTMQFNLSALATFKWYLLRGFNLPEGVDRGGVIFYLLFIIIVFLLMFSIWKYFRQKKINLRVLVFSVGMFIFGALPFYFLPGHMSSYYLTISVFGMALIFSEVFRGKIVLVVMGLYLIMTILGLQFLSQTHWIILKNTGPIGQF